MQPKALISTEAKKSPNRDVLNYLAKGCLHSLDWTTGLNYFSFLCTSEQFLFIYLDCQWLMHNMQRTYYTCT